MAQGLADRRPLNDIAFVDLHVSLGIPVEPDATMIGLLKQVEQRAQRAWRGTLAGIELLGLPLAAALAALRARVQPGACHGAALLVIRGDWATRLDAIYDRWVSELLDLTQPAPRVCLLREIGMPWRLSTTTLRQAFGFWARVQAMPQSALPPRVLRLAGQSQATWTAAMQHHAGGLNVRPFREWVEAAAAAPPEALGREARKRLIRRNLVEEVDLQLQRREDFWVTAERARHPGRGLRVAADAAEFRLTCRAIRPWAQWRLQGRFTSSRAARRRQPVRGATAWSLTSSTSHSAATLRRQRGTPQQGQPGRARQPQRLRSAAPRTPTS
ncbi:unnamed protein product [Prorocentrum cordatum]|uniref:Uncharacterized protein n=1 Tax=Prorocentrum cordatum TaxID=2364126 RepID=A0ABN9VW25_9DINO|nr:unnamed protein product [Polarella glacialis]